MKDEEYYRSPRSSPQPEIRDTNKIAQRIRAAREKQNLQIEMTNDLNNLSKLHPNARRYSIRMTSYLLRAFLVSTTCYTIFSLFLPIPSPRTMFTYQKQLLCNVHSSLTDLSQTHLIIEENTKNWPKNVSIILAVDACSVNPSVTLFSNQTIQGLIKKTEKNEEFQTSGQITIKLFEEWLSNHSHLIIDSMFLFNVQPLNPDLRSFIIYIHPSKSGKGDMKIINILKNLTNQLKKFNINTVSYAADGDSYFIPLHLKNIKNHIIGNTYYTSPSSSEPVVISDPLHLLKRARYHLIPYIYNKTQFVDILNLPSMSIRNDKASKMHDRLPIQIFQLKNYEKLCQKQLFNYSFYILPHTLLLSGLSYWLNYEDRLILFHLSRCIFQKIYESPKNIIFNGQIQYKNQLINDSFSTLISICDILHKNPNIKIHLNRFGTNPVEHNLGMIRMRSKDHHKAERFIKEASKINAMRQLREDMVADVISHRDLQFGKIINTSFIYVNLYYIEKMAFSLIYEVKTQKCDETCKKTHAFFKSIIEVNNISCNKCYLFKSDDVMLAPNANVMIEKR